MLAGPHRPDPGVFADMLARFALAALCAMLAAPALAFPADGYFIQGFTCPEEGFVPDPLRTATLTFPTLCHAGICCDLSNPIRIRDMTDVFLYDGQCREDDRDFVARLLVGDSSGDGIIVVLNANAYTYSRCEP